MGHIKSMLKKRARDAEKGDQPEKDETPTPKPKAVKAEPKSKGKAMRTK